MDSLPVPWQTTAMETAIKREWCSGSDLEIPIDLVETDWDWGTFLR